MKRLCLALGAVLVIAAPLLFAAVSDEAVRLRNLSTAELENEQPALAEETLARLLEVVEDDPLPFANLAIATLRQQRFDEALEWIDKALEIDPKDPALITIRADVLQWSGSPDKAFELYRQAAALAPDRADIHYALYRQTSMVPPEVAADVADQTLEQLARLRPENLLVSLQRGQRAIANGNRQVATEAYLRIRELLWQAPPAAETLVTQILDALAADDLAAARVPGLRLENVLKITPMYREGLRELTMGIQGMPLELFRDEPKATALGRPAEVRFRGQALTTKPGTGHAVAVADLDGDQKSDIAWIVDDGAARLETRLSSKGGEPGARLPAAGVEHLVAADLDNDGWWDLIGYGPEKLLVWRGTGDGALEEATERFGLAAAGATGCAVFDFDVEGDLDLALAGGRSGNGELYRNSLAGPLEPVGAKSLPEIGLGKVSEIVASDLDRDGDIDLLIAHDRGLTWLDNLRQGTFGNRTVAAGLSRAAPARAVVSTDLDRDGFPDLVTAGKGLQLFHNRGGSFEPWSVDGLDISAPELAALVALDADNDGRMDLATGGPAGLSVYLQRSGPKFEPLPLDDAPTTVIDLAATDMDQDCDLDLIAVGGDGLYRLDNDGGSSNHCLSVRLRGLDKGNSKNNLHGLGTTLEVRAGTGYQFQEADSDVSHFGLGQLSKADLLRVVWTNGVPQNRLDVQSNQWIVEEQLLKGSCPFLYAWNGEQVQFVTDLLWGAPLGLPVAPGVWASTDPRELVRVDSARPQGTIYELRITEELWEAAFFDYVRLWVVDHPAKVEVASSLKIIPGAQVPDEVMGTRELRPVVAAWDGSGREVTTRVARRDEIYADGWKASPYQGVSIEPWTFTLDLGEAPAAPVRLLLDGWIFPADASLNLAVAQRTDLATWPPRLEVETPGGWQTLMPSMGHPAGKTKTMVVDTPPLPAGAHRLRIVATQWLSWDRVVWSLAPADDEPLVRARLAPAVADLHYRGFSAPVRPAPNGPHLFDYAQLRTDSPWLPFPGRYTRYGDVRALLQESDDRSVILAPGDELTLRFEAGGLPPPADGWRRTIFLESHGWDKDADRNIYEGQQVEPLPFRAMSGYPYGTDESFPDTPLHRNYRSEWLTREVVSRWSSTYP
ncbi:MAG: FG-GAP-like repeat-containing protein [Thermoanaerobaculia bacterium]